MLALKQFSRPLLTDRLVGQCWDSSARCQYTVTGWDEKFGLQLLSQCGSTYNCLSRSVPEIHSCVPGTLNNQPTNKQTAAYSRIPLCNQPRPSNALCMELGRYDTKKDTNTLWHQERHKHAMTPRKTQTRYDTKKDTNTLWHQERHKHVMTPRKTQTRYDTKKDTNTLWHQDINKHVMTPRHK